MNVFDVVFWTLIVLSLTGAASINFGWIILFFILSIIF